MLGIPVGAALAAARLSQEVTGGLLVIDIG